MPLNLARAAAAAAAGVLLLVPSLVPGPSGAASAQRYVAARPVCRPVAPGRMRCLAQRVVQVTRSTPDARPLPKAARPGYAIGPAGGYTPGDLATVYGVPADASTTQTVGVVDAYDDPNAVNDLNVFDRQYGLAQETGTSLTKYSQRGGADDLPVPNASWAGEESLDLDAVRGLCHLCRIVLVEADSDSDANLAAAENEAVALGATVISNSFGEAESGAIPPAIAAAFNHPKVVIVAGAGDDGMNSWDLVNQGSQSANAPFYPASLNTVVAAGGTTLELNDDGTRSSEGVWNENGPADEYGSLLEAPFGATGGGCSTRVAAQRWQTATAGWTGTGCGTHRLSADISALADPFTGYDVYDSYQSAGWQQVGGTSLSTPLVAAMWAVAGGSGGISYPALTLYGHARTSAAASFYDVTEGGNGYCGGEAAAQCSIDAGQAPNTLGDGYVDCAFLSKSATPSTGTRACDAATGYDGPSGVGAPYGLTGFRSLRPAATIVQPASAVHGQPAGFTARVSDPFPGGAVTNYRWSWGDGSPTTTTPTAAHTYARAGTYRVSLSIADSYHLGGTSSARIVVS